MTHRFTRGAHRHPLALVAGLALFATIGGRAAAEIVIYNTLEEWQSAAATPVTFLNFAGLGGPGPVLFNTQYSAFGVTDPEDNDYAASYAPSLDGWRLQGVAPGLTSNPSITLDFAASIHSVAIRYIPGHYLDLYQQGELVAGSIILSTFGLELGVRGVVSSHPFDRVVIRRFFNEAALIDDLYFETIPAPGMVAPLALAAIVLSRRRRQR